MSTLLNNISNNYARDEVIALTDESQVVSIAMPSEIKHCECLGKIEGLLWVGKRKVVPGNRKGQYRPITAVIVYQLSGKEYGNMELRKVPKVELQLDIS